MNGHMKIMLAMTVMALAVGGMLVLQDSEDSDASYGTNTNPVSSVSMSIYTLYNSYDATIYIYNGGSVSLRGGNNFTAYSVADSSFGISVSGQNFTGIVSKTGDTTLTYQEERGGITLYGAIQLHSITAPEPEPTTYSMYYYNNNAEYGTVIGERQSGSGSSAVWAAFSSGSKFEAGTNIKLTASPAEGCSFVSWTRGSTIVSTSAVYTFAMPSATTSYTANFILNNPKYAINYSSADSDAGNVMGYRQTGSGSSAVWSAFASGTTYEAGQTIKLIANPSENYRFVRWADSGGTTISTDAEYIFTSPSSIVNYIAYFEQYKFAFSVSSADSEKGSAIAYRYLPDSPTTKVYFTGTIYLEAGSLVGVEATASSGHNFRNWTVNGSVVSSIANYEFNTPGNDYYMVANFGDAPREYTLTFSANNSSYGTVRGYILNDGVKEYFTSPHQLLEASEFYLEATPNTGYRFDHWNMDDLENVSTSPTIDNFMPSHDRTFVAVFSAKPVHTLSVAANDSTFGRIQAVEVIDGEPTYIVPPVSVYEGDEIRLLATPYNGYQFDRWTLSGTGTVSTDRIYTFTMPNHDVTYTAVFSEKPPVDVWWTNGYINGSVEIAFSFDTSSAVRHTMDIPLYEYNGRESDVETDPRGVGQFDQTDYSLRIVTGYNTTLTLSVLQNDTLIGQQYTYQMGTWPQYALLIDAQRGTLTFKGINTVFEQSSAFSFINYNVSFEKEIVDFSDKIRNLAMLDVHHRETGNGNAPRFQVSSTMTYLNTYGFVMVDPSINIIEKFPGYDNLRLNFYSFAYFGDSITINGHTLTMSGSTVSFWYVPKNTPIKDEHGQIISYTQENKISTSTDPDAKEFKGPLNNIFVTYTNISSATASERICYLTFVNDNRFEVNMGTFESDDLTIDFDGVWYFTNFLYEPYTAIESSYELDPWSFFNLNQNGFILILDLFMIIGFIVANKVYVLGFLDKAIMGAALVISFVLLVV